MKAAVYHGARDIRVQTIADPPAPAPQEVRLKVLRAALCGTDAAEFSHGPIVIPLTFRHPGSGHQGPLVMGHEFVGEIEAVGSEVDGWSVGDRVVPGGGMWCGRCDWCESGRTNLCAHYYTLGLQANGGLAEAVNAPALMCRAVPAECSDDAAAIAQPLAVALHAVRRAGVGAGHRVAIIGTGGIGFFILAAALSAGASDAVVIDIDDEKLAVALGHGATATIHAQRDDVNSVVNELTDGNGFDIVLEASGAPPSPPLAQRIVKRGGRIVMVGMHHGPRDLDFADLTIREVDLISPNAHVCGVDLPEALEMLREPDLAKTAINRIVALDDVVAGGFEPLAAGGVRGKVVISPVLV